MLSQRSAINSPFPTVSRPAPGRHIIVMLSLLLGLTLGGMAMAAPEPVEIVIKDHLFIPSQVRIPAGKPAILKIKNEDDSAEEFESIPLKIEKIVTGGGEIIVRLRPLPPGQYSFFGEYNADTAQGIVVVE